MSEKATFREGLAALCRAEYTSREVLIGLLDSLMAELRGCEVGRNARRGEEVAVPRGEILLIGEWTMRRVRGMLEEGRNPRESIYPLPIVNGFLARLKSLLGETEVDLRKGVKALIVSFEQEYPSIRMREILKAVNFFDLLDEALFLEDIESQRTINLLLKAFGKSALRYVLCKY